MITETPVLIEPVIEINSPADWKQILAGAINNSERLLQALELPLDVSAAQRQAADEFPVLVPQPFLNKMQKGNPQDPLLIQVLPRADETESAPGFVSDPLSEQHSNTQKGIIHKYHGRVLVLLSTGCAVNCRYCFRRHFPYKDNRVGKRDWHEILDYLRADNSIEEVILSGGDPLMLGDTQLQEFLHQIEKIKHIRRLRMHSRLPVMIPQRITQALVDMLACSRFDCSLVLHINHINEVDQELTDYLRPLRLAGITLLNQTVLLKGVNDSVEQLASLSKGLFHSGILPYYLHLLDRVMGAQHFEISEKSALNIYQGLLLQLPGYLVPKLVREESGKGSKTPIPILS